jgi:hypothetical protein
LPHKFLDVNLHLFNSLREDEMLNTKKVIVILKFSFLLCIVFYSTVYSQGVKESSYFPLRIGNQWFFSSQNDTLSETVADTQRIGGNLYYSLEKFRDYSGFLFRVFDNRVYIFADTSEYLWYDFKADSSDSWTVPPLGHPYGGGLLTMQSKTDTVFTPSGTFTDCYRIYHHIGSDAEFVEWFAPGIGIVQRDVITIVGLRRWILVDKIITSVRSSTGFVSPTLYFLSQNYPNPFNPVTTVNYQIPELSFVTLKVYDVLGNEVAALVNEEKPIGNYVVEFSANNLPTGIYFYRLQAGSFVETKKMVLMK